jgi:4a-hydroxytetrahydrobiopterin dehydratase
MEPLREKKCEICKSDAVPLKGALLYELKKQLDASWEIVDDHHLVKDYRFQDFAHGLKFVNFIGELAEKEGHHPTITLSYTKVTIVLFTHKIKGLSHSDFILADKIDAIYASFEPSHD